MYAMTALLISLTFVVLFLGITVGALAMATACTVVARSALRPRRIASSTEFQPNRAPTRLRSDR
jgi:hypothetical protein